MAANEAAGRHAIGNNRLIRGDVVRGDVLDGDLLLPSASVVIEPFRKHYHSAGSLVGELQVFSPHLEKSDAVR